MFSSGSPGLGPHRGLLTPNVLAELLVVQDVKVSGRLDQLNQSRCQLGVLVQLLELWRDAGGKVRVRRSPGSLLGIGLHQGGRQGLLIIGELLLVDRHHLDEVAHRVLPVKRGSSATLEAPQVGATVYHWNGAERKGDLLIKDVVIIINFSSWYAAIILMSSAPYSSGPVRILACPMSASGWGHSTSLEWTREE